MRCYDLSLTEAMPEPQTQRDRLASSIKLGYHGGAVVHQAETKLQVRDKCAIQRVEVDSLLTAHSGLEQALRSAQPGDHKQQPALAQEFRQLTRLTFAAEDPAAGQACCSNSGIVSTYDLLAVQPQTQEAFVSACMAMEVDIISIDLARRLPYKLRPLLVKAALARGVQFEICYAPALRDPASRRQLLANAQALCRAARGRGIIVSSAARSSSELRGPHDVVNLATFFGLTPQQAQAAITKNAEAVLQHALSRRAHRGILIMQDAGAAWP